MVGGRNVPRDKVNTVENLNLKFVLVTLISAALDAAPLSVYKGVTSSVYARLLVATPSGNGWYVNKVGNVKDPATLADLMGRAHVIAAHTVGGREITQADYSEIAALARAAVVAEGPPALAALKAKDEAPKASAAGSSPDIDAIIAAAVASALANAGVAAPATVVAAPVPQTLPAGTPAQKIEAAIKAKDWNAARALGATVDGRKSVEANIMANLRLLQTA